MQAPRRGQIEQLRVTAHFQEHRREFAQPCRFLGNPQGIGELAYIRNEKVARRQAGKTEKARRIRETRFRKSRADAYPQNGPSDMPSPGQSGHAQCETRGRAGVAGIRSVNFRQGGIGQATAQGNVETLGARSQRV